MIFSGMEAVPFSRNEKKGKGTEKKDKKWTVSYNQDVSVFTRGVVIYRVEGLGSSRLWQGSTLTVLLSMSSCKNGMPGKLLRKLTKILRTSISFRA